ncbi:MAG: hypothetical protein ACHQIG_12095, partial [Acidimicrobiia bacterium]
AAAADDIFGDAPTASPSPIPPAPAPSPSPAPAARAEPVPVVCWRAEELPVPTGVTTGEAPLNGTPGSDTLRPDPMLVNGTGANGTTPDVPVAPAKKRRFLIFGRR